MVKELRYSNEKIDGLISIGPLMVRQLYGGGRKKTVGVGFLSMNIVKSTGRIYLSLNEGRVVKTTRQIPMDLIKRLITLREEIKPITQSKGAGDRIRVNQVAVDYWIKHFKGIYSTKEYNKNAQK